MSLDQKTVRRLTRKPGYKERPSRWGSCTRKQPFPTNEAAAERVLELRAAGMPGVFAYECRFCKAWHVGHAPNSPLGALDAKQWAARTPSWWPKGMPV
jgi:hypothetical protein